MKTPFDTVLRMRRREIDRTRIAIHAETSRLVEIDQASETLREEISLEYEASANQWAMSTEAFMRRKLSHRAQLVAQRIAVSQEIYGLRRQATEAYGSMQVVENAADRFRADHRRWEQRAEQRASDDLGAARIARTRNAQDRPATLRLPAR